jgi:hypothetical protein
MRLKSLLKAMDPDTWQGILTFWNIPAPTNGDAPPSHDRWVDFLFSRMQNPALFRGVMARLAKSQRELLIFLALHGGALCEKELLKRQYAGDRERMRTDTETLGGQGLLYTEKWSDAEGKTRTVLGVPESFLRLIELPHFWQGYLGAFLHQLPVEHLYRIATEGLKLTNLPARREMLAHEVRIALTDPDRLRAYVEGLTETERETFLLLLQRRGVCLYRDLAEWVHHRLPEGGRASVIDDLLARSGLVFPSAAGVPKQEMVLRVPRDLYHIATHQFPRDQRCLAELDVISHVNPALAPKNVYSNGGALLRDLVIFVGYVERHSVRRLGNGGIGKNELKKILTRLSANKTLKYAQFLTFYSIRRRFLVPEGENWGVSATFVDVLRDARTLYGDIYDTWRETNEWNEEFLDGDCLHTDHPPINLLNIVELRDLVLENLARIPFDTWIDGPRFVESLLVQIDSRIPHRGGRSRLDKSNRINYLVVETVLCESLYWLGLAALGLHETTYFEELGNRQHVDSARNGGNGTAGAKDPTHRADQLLNFNPRPFLPDGFHFYFQITPLGRSILNVHPHPAEKTATAAAGSATTSPPAATAGASTASHTTTAGASTASHTATTCARTASHTTTTCARTASHTTTACARTASHTTTACARTASHTSAEAVVLPYLNDAMQFTVLPNLDVVAPPDLSLCVFWQLRQIAEMRHIDVMSTLALTPASVRAGMEQGWKGEDILAFLSERCPGGLPETVRHLVEECSKRFGEFVIGYAGGYILAEDQALREDLLNLKVLEPWLKDVKGEHLLLLNRSAEVQQVARELKALGFMPSVDNENVYASAEGRLRYALAPADLASLLAILRFVSGLEKDLGTDPTEEKAPPLLNLLRPSNYAQLNIDPQVETLCKRFEKAFEAALEKKIEAATSKYRRQMRGVLAHKRPARARPAYAGANPATTPEAVREMLHFAIEHESVVSLQHRRSTGEEVVEQVRPESISGDKLYAFCEEDQSYCAYRITRISSARMD